MSYVIIPNPILLDHFLVPFLFLPLKEENGNDDTDDEDHSQHWANHPEKALFLIHNWLGVHK